MIPAANQSWTNNSSNLLTVSSNVTGAATLSNTTVLTLAGSGTGGALLSGTIGDGTNGGNLVLAVNTPNAANVLSGNNSYSGGTTLTAGALNATTNTALGTGAVTMNPSSGTALLAVTAAPAISSLTMSPSSATALLTISGTTAIGSVAMNLSSGTASLTLGGAAASIGSLSSNGAGASFLVLGNATGAGSATTLTLGSNNAPTTFGGVISDLSLSNSAATGALVKVGIGAMTLTANNTFTGGMIVNSGTLALQGVNSATPAGRSTLTINAGGTVIATPGFDNQLGLETNGYMTAMNIVGGTFLAGNSEHVNSITMTGGALGVAGGASQVSGMDLRAFNSVNPSVTTLASSATATISSLMTLDAPATFNIAHGTVASDLTVSGVIGGTGSLTKASNGLMTLTAVCSYSGTTTINGGTLQLNTSPGNANGELATPAIVVNSGGLLALNAGDVLGYTANREVLVINGGTVSNITSASRVTLQNAVNMTGGVLTGSGTGDAYGVYSFNSANGFNATSDANGNPAIVNAKNISLQAANLTFNVTRGVASPASDLNVVAAIVPFNGSTYGISKTGNGIMTLLGSNTYTGVTAINGGTLQIGNNGTTGTLGTGTVTDNSALVFNRTDTGLSVADAVSGTGSVTQAGSGMTTLSGTNGYSGGTNFNAGELSTSADYSLGNTSGPLDFNGGALQVTGTNFTSTTRTINLSAGGGSFDISNSANAFTVSQNIVGSGPLTKLGAGILVLSGSNAYGTTTVSAGTLQLGGVNALGSSPLIMSGGVLQTNGYNASAADLSGAGGQIQNGSLSLASTLTVGSDNLNTTYSGAFSNGSTGSLTLVKTGSGMLTLKGGNSLHASQFVVNSGTLSIGAVDTVTSGHNVASDTTFTVNAGATFMNAAITGVVNRIADVNLNGATWTLTGSDSNWGTFYMGTLPDGSNPVLTVGGNSPSIINGNGNLKMGPMLTFNVGSTGGTAADLTVAVPLQDQTNAQGFASANLAKTGAGSMLLTAANTYTGNTVVSGGTLDLSTGGGIYTGAAKAGTDSLVVSGGAVLKLSAWGAWGTTGPLGELNYNNGYLRVNNGTICLTANDSANANRGINIDTGGATLEALGGVTWTLGAGANTLYGTGPLTLAGAGNGTISTAVSTSGPLNMNGTGTWILAGASSNVSAVNVNAGWFQVNGPLTASVMNVYAGQISGSGSITINNVDNGLYYSSTAASTFAGTVAGAGDVEVSSGTLTLSGNNTCAGGAQVYSGGTLRMGADNALPYGAGVSNVVVGVPAPVGPGTLDLAGFTANVNGLTGNGTVDNTTGNGTLVVGNNNATSTFSGTIQNTAGPLALYKTGGGTFTLTGSSTYAGGTTMNNGMLVLANGANGSALGSGTLTLNGGILAAGPAGGSISGLVQAGSAAHTIAPAAGLTSGYGTLNLNGGLSANADTTLAFNLNLFSATGGSDAAGNSIYGGDLINLGGAGLSGSGNFTFNGFTPTSLGDYRLVSSSPSNLSSLNLSNFTLPSFSGTNDTYTLSTSADSGFLDLVVAPGTTPAVFTLSASAAVGLLHVNDSTTVTATIANMGTGLADSLHSSLGLNASGGSLSGPGLPLTGLVLGQGTSASGSQTYTAGVAGTITLTPTAAATNGTNGASVSAGTTNVATISVFSGSATWTGNLAVGSSASWGSGANGNWADNNGVQAAPGTFTNFANTDSATFSGSGSVTKIDLTTANPSLASLNFSGTNYTLTNGTLTLNSSTGPASVVVSGGTQEIASAIVLASSAAIGPQIGTQLTLSGDISDGGNNMALALTDSGTLVLSGTNNSYTGGTYVEQGTLYVQNSGAIQDGSALYVGAGGTFIFDPTVTGSAADLSQLTRATAHAGAEVVPEPSTLTLLATAGALLLLRCRKRRRDRMAG